MYLTRSLQVAIKTIKKCKIETEADLIRIRREIQIMSSVQHPNIIHIYEGMLHSWFFNMYKNVLAKECRFFYVTWKHVMWGWI